MTDEPDDHVITRRELGLVLDKIAEQFKTLESRLTVKILIAAVAGSALGKTLSPSVAAGVAAVGVIGWGVKVLIVGLLHR